MRSAVLIHRRLAPAAGAILAMLVLLALAMAPGAQAARPTAGGNDIAVFAHRGSSGVAPENTLAAVDTAIRQGANWFEIDLQRTADGELVLVHDRTLARTTNVGEVFPARRDDPVGSFTLAELQQLDAGSWFAPEFAGEGVPTLAELLELIHQRIGFLLEVKDPALYPGIEQDIVDVLEAAPGYLDAALAGDRLIVQSFDHESMRRLHEAAPEIPVGLLSGSRMSPEALADAAEWATDIVASQRVTDQAFVDAVQALGMRMSVYTVNTGRDMRRVLGLGVDGIATDYPVVLLDILRRS